MTLSGWTRLWIVASLSIWIGGFFWLSTVEYGGQRMPPLQTDSSMCNPWNEFRPETNSQAPADASAGGWRIVPTEDPDHPSCPDRAAVAWNYDWSDWLERSARSGHLPLVAFGPFILGALMLGIGWVRKGFNSPQEKTKTPTGPPDS